PASKLATARHLNGDTLASSLGAALGVERADADDLYAALDWLLRGQARIEKKLARRHLQEGQLILWDASPVPFESHTCRLAAFGRPRGSKKSQRQITFGLLLTPGGLPVATEVFPGNTGDPSTVTAALDRVTERFGLRRVVVVGDRGMLTQARITEELEPRGVDWITSLRSPTIRKLMREGPLQLSLFDERDLAEISSPEFPGERLLCCRNPLLAADRARKRQELLAATERELGKIAAATRRQRRPLRGEDRIGVRVGRVLGHSKVAKHFRYEITEDSFSFERDEDSIAHETDLDGIYVIRTSLSEEELGAEDVVRAYKRLSVVERAFRVSKDFALEVEPIRHRREDRVRAHVFLCMLAFYVYKHMERALAPILFTDHQPEAAEARRASIVAPATRSEAALRKVRRRRTDQGHPLHAFDTLLTDLATLTQNTVQVADTEVRFEQYAEPTALQQRAFDLLDVSYRL
ncbi:MAG TPA: IS1634 family transposase, partial [Longimicrobiales bacterium]|nr:IS1634 family transposase [Longimicrobiales bacterium]